MKAQIAVSFAACAMFAATTLVTPRVASAQTPGDHKPPKVLVIDREYVKPGKAGSLHEKAEGAFIKALTEAKSPAYYISMDSLSGPQRSLFFFPFDSFKEWGKQQESEHANPALSAALDQAYIEDGENLSQSGSSAYLYHPELSLHEELVIPHMRYFEITQFHVKPGHQHEFEEMAKLEKICFEKMADVHWAAFESMDGENNGGMWIVVNPMKSLDEVDKGLASGKQFEASVGAAGMKHMEELASACIESSQTNVFAVNTKNSY